MKSFGRLYLVA